MSPRLLYFACDRCMNRWSAYRASECPACGHDAVWEFDKESNRDQYVHDHELLFRRAPASRRMANDLASAVDSLFPGFSVKVP